MQLYRAFSRTVKGQDAERQAFPLAVFAHKCEDNTKKIMDIPECAVSPIKLCLPYSRCRMAGLNLRVLTVGGG